MLRLFQATESLYYDETPLIRLSVDDLDLDAFGRYLQRTGQTDLTGDQPRLLRAWGLLGEGHPTVAGLLLFGRDPQRHLPFAQINAARVPGIDASVAPSDRKDMSGRLLDMIEDAQRFLRLHLAITHEIRGFEPEPHPELPEEALREAVVNSIGHRDYTIQGRCASSSSTTDWTSTPPASRPTRSTSRRCAPASTWCVTLGSTRASPMPDS